MTSLRISLAQMPIEAGNLPRNISTFKKHVQEAAAREAKLVVFPELWSTGYALDHANDFADELNRGLFQQIATEATENKIAIVGTTLEKRGMSIHNSMSFFAPNGRSLGVYRKMHLIRLLNEDKYLTPGNAPLTAKLPWGVTGFAICYDLRFPEVFRRYTVQEGAMMVIISAEWPIERIEHWRSLLIARAIENQCYMVAVNTAGKSGNHVFGGHSMIVDPLGKIVAEAGEQPQHLTVDIDLDIVATVRKNLPFLDDYRIDIYN
ncbi:carbon-nitrogen family hydrolase [Anaerolineales bacterium]